MHLSAWCGAAALQQHGTVRNVHIEQVHLQGRHACMQKVCRLLHVQACHVGSSISSAQECCQHAWRHVAEEQVTLRYRAMMAPAASSTTCVL